MNYKHALIVEVADQGKNSVVHLLPLQPTEARLLANLQAEKGTATRQTEKKYYAERIRAVLEKIKERERVVIEHPGKKPPAVEEIMVKEGQTHRVLTVSERFDLVKAYQKAVQAAREKQQP